MSPLGRLLTSIYKLHTVFCSRWQHLILCVHMECVMNCDGGVHVPQCQRFAVSGGKCLSKSLNKISVPRAAGPHSVYGLIIC